MEIYIKFSSTKFRFQGSEDISNIQSAKTTPELCTNCIILQSYINSMEAHLSTIMGSFQSVPSKNFKPCVTPAAVEDSKNPDLVIRELRKRKILCATSSIPEKKSKRTEVSSKLTPSISSKELTNLPKEDTGVTILQSASPAVVIQDEQEITINEVLLEKDIVLPAKGDDDDPVLIAADPCKIIFISGLDSKTTVDTLRAYIF